MSKNLPRAQIPLWKIVFILSLLRDNIFIPSRGSRKKALKVMVVLTDGDIFGDPLNLTTVINSPKMQGVERFAIGVRAKSWETTPGSV